MFFFLEFRPLRSHTDRVSTLRMNILPPASTGHMCWPDSYCIASLPHCLRAKVPDITRLCVRSHQIWKLWRLHEHVLLCYWCPIAAPTDVPKESCTWAAISVGETLLQSSSLVQEYSTYCCCQWNFWFKGFWCILSDFNICLSNLKMKMKWKCRSISSSRLVLTINKPFFHCCHAKLWLSHLSGWLSWMKEMTLISIPQGVQMLHSHLAILHLIIPSVEGHMFLHWKFSFFLSFFFDFAQTLNSHTAAQVWFDLQRKIVYMKSHRKTDFFVLLTAFSFLYCSSWI